MTHRLRGALARHRDDFLYTLRRRPLVALARAVASVCLLVVLALAGWVEVASRSVLDDVGPSERFVFGVDFGLDYGHWHRVRRFPLLVDTTGRGVGMIPPSAIPGAPARPGYKTAVIDELPPQWWDLVVALEDANRGRWFHRWGVDVKGLLRAVLRGGSGGSTTAMQLTKTIKLDTDAAGLQRVVRKARDLAHAPVLARALSRAGADGEGRWFATHVPMLKSDLHGLTHAAWVLWGKAPDVLSLGQQALLAAAVKWRVELVREDRHAHRRLARAIHGLTLLERRGVIDGPTLRRATDEAREAAVELAAWRRRQDACRGKRVAFALSGSPERPDQYAAEHLAGQLEQAVFELHDAFGGEGAWWNRVAVVKLAVNVDASCTTRARVASVWSDLRLAHPDMDREAWFALALADDRGRIVELVGGSPNPWYHGPPVPGGVTQVGQGPREIGSVGKVAVAVLAARAGDTPSGRWTEMPRRRAGGRPYVNYGGGRGDAGRRLPATDVFATSNNLAALWRLDRPDIDERDMRALLRGFGLRPRATEPERIRAELPESLALGTAQATPRDLHRMVQTLGLALRGGEARPTACTPHLVDAVRLRGRADFSPIVRSWAGCTRAVESLLPTAGEQGFVREVLSAVVERGSAASTLGALSATSSDRVGVHLAKTGTVGAAGGVTRLANVVGSVAIDGRLYSYVLQVGPPPGGHLGRRMTGGRAARLLVPVLDSLLDPGGPS